MQEKNKIKANKQHSIVHLGKATKLTFGKGKTGFEMAATRVYS